MSNFSFPPPHMIKNHNPGEGGLFLRFIYTPRSFSKSNVTYSWKMPRPMLSLENGVLNQSFMKFYQFIDSNKYSIQSKFFFIVYCKNGKYECYFGVKYNCHKHLQYIFFFLISSNRIYQNYHPSILFFD